MAFNPELGSTSPTVLLDNAERLDKLVNGSALTEPDRAGVELDTWRGMMAKNEALTEETRQNLIPLSRQYATLAAAQADIANIPVGSTTYYRSPDDSALAVEVINNAGTLQPTGRKMPSYSSLRGANILFDALNEYSANDPKFGAWDWYRGAVVTFSTTDANIPLPTPVAQYSGVWSADKYYDLARLPVRVGDKLTFSVLAWFQDAGAKFHIFWMSTAGAVISSKSQLALAAGINTPVITDVIPSGASYVRIRVENTSAGIFKVGAYAAALGAIQPEFVRATPDKTYLSAVISSGISGLTSRVDALQGAISVGYAYAAAWQVGKFINPTTGAITDNSALNCAIIPHSDGDGWLVTALVTGSATALAVYMNSAGMVLGVEGRGTATPQQYTNYRLNVPAGTTQIGITGRNSAEIAVKKLAVVETATVLASIDSLDVRVQTIEDSLVYDFIKQDVTITSGAYINRADGSVVANAAFDCAIFNYTAGDRWKVTARVNGSGVSLAVYMNSTGMVIGTEGNGTTESVDYTDYELTPPSGTARIGITTRIAVPIIAKKYVVVPGGSTVSPWSGKVIDVMGDSNVAYNKWQPLVAAELGCTFLNHGVGGSKIAKPDSSSTQISMCDDVRINALDTSAAAWICGPWATNDWAQNIPIGSITDSVNTTVYGALNIIAQKLRARAPTKPILWATPFNGDYDSGRTGAWVDGETNQYGRVSDYAAAIRAVALRYGFPLIDLNADCGWTKFNSTSFLLTEGDTNPSRIHLNADAGPVRISSLITDRLAALQKLVG
ncbi:TPA: SGNH/GDSL hydrolase family protein [Klebsiella pneumoniae]|uniref:SGNH/GDSL hydrolase family protein n=2 Tax=Klebsiella pneumoniae TaxID=573 RepID=UPI000E2D1FC3|nr:SGNH/GDSL hydrolase family protein [Klebsiella pneumoniae]EJL9159234.1 SGNH/GDSL hydrolase family protein [Klebsiella pneumoniae]EJR0210586.1 SGNH/GDSL hydrolase family protein [Klebsiella pneumoniae]EJR0312983.1 SGNH/GDSL hydrolase family protein [Klebsiella pneumoniae]SXT20977.1 flagellar biosynthesis, cell-distal portion of basal-body rod [Klebsiella pneumoniae]HBV4748695.1 SGNH/GDSL hydrolase family protein [Klebsiella pneumoniae]